MKQCRQRFLFKLTMIRDKLYLGYKFACSFSKHHYVPKQCLRLRRIHFLLICCVSLPEHCRMETQFSLECAGKIILTNSVVLLSLLQYLPVHRMPFVQSHLHLCRLTTRNTRVLLDLQPQMQGINWLAATNKTFPRIFYSHPVRVQVILFYFSARVLFVHNTGDWSNEIVREKHCYRACLARHTRFRVLLRCSSIKLFWAVLLFVFTRGFLSIRTDSAYRDSQRCNKTSKTD